MINFNELRKDLILAISTDADLERFAYRIGREVLKGFALGFALGAISLFLCLMILYGIFN